LVPPISCQSAIRREDESGFDKNENPNAYQKLAIEQMRLPGAYSLTAELVILYSSSQSRCDMFRSSLFQRVSEDSLKAELYTRSLLRTALVQTDIELAFEEIAEDREKGTGITDC